MKADAAPDDPLPDLLAGDRAAAAAARRLLSALLRHDLDRADLETVAAELDAVTARISAHPSRTKNDLFRSPPAMQRSMTFLDTGSWPGPPPDGSVVVFDPVSFVGGQLSPLTAGTVYRRRGDEAEAEVVFDAAFEGPPGRAHGGAVAAVFDEVMGSVFRVRGLPSAFTGHLAVRYSAPAPLGAAVVFTARIAASRDRVHEMEAEAVAGGITVATATGVFIEMTAEQVRAAFTG
ncbi:MAG: PaaI family thioesterase [Acidimicrobiales bacterium]